MEVVLCTKLTTIIWKDIISHKGNVETTEDQHSVNSSYGTSSSFTVIHVAAAIH